jgi:hypothetical protein
MAGRGRDRESPARGLCTSHHESRPHRMQGRTHSFALRNYGYTAVYESS